MPLNTKQREAADRFLSFLLSEELIFRIYGEGGTGKSFLVRHLVKNVFPEYELFCKTTGIKQALDSYALTATTNKAAGILQTFLKEECETIYSLCKVVIKADFKTGQQHLVPIDKNTVLLENMVVFIDEASMLSKEMLEIIRTRSGRNVKLVLIGDPYQLPPVNEEPLEPEPEGPYTIYLTEPMRNKESPGLVQLCSDLRNHIEKITFPDLHKYKDNVEFLTVSKAQWFLDTLSGNDMVLSYTNEKALQYCTYVCEQHNISDMHYKGGKYLNNSFVESKGNFVLHPDEEVTISHISQPQQLRGLHDHLEVYYCDLRTGDGNAYKNVPVAKDPQALKSLLKQLSLKKRWKDFYFIKEGVADLRPATALTIHKSQGSTYDAVYIDLDSFNSCRDPLQALKLMYVAVSRARKQVYFYGQDSRFG